MGTMNQTDRQDSVRTSQAVVAKVKFWKEQLLDLTLRNRLLNFRLTKTSTVGIDAPDPSAVYTSLVGGNARLTFAWQGYNEPVGTEGEDGPTGHQPDLLTPSQPTASRPRLLMPHEVRSDRGDDVTRRALYGLRQKGNSHISERGVNALYAAFGFLEWRKAEHSRDFLKAPIVLVPLEILRENGGKHYSVKQLDEDIVLNPTLAHVLLKEFGLTLPPLPDDADEMDLYAYLEQVQRAVVISNPEWKVHHQVYLSLLSFHKLPMYQELEDRGSLAGFHPIVAALAGDPSKLSPPPADIPEPHELDGEVSLSDTYQILDADPYQQAAVVAAKKGQSFVLEGPPGTGKSQTIANIIAECLAARKKVLFVSEKMAALEVVYSRLEDNGLASPILELHSHKAKKREFLDTMARALSEGLRSNGTRPHRPIEDLESIRQKLNGYAEAVHKVREPLHASIYQVHGRLAVMEGAPDVAFSYEAVEEATPETLVQVEDILRRFQSREEVIRRYHTHPWNGCAITAATMEKRADIRIVFPRLARCARDLDAGVRSMAGKCGVQAEPTLSGVEWLTEVASLLSATPRPPAAWFSSPSLDTLLGCVSVYAAEFDTYQIRRAVLMESYTEEVFGLSHPYLRGELTATQQALKPRWREYSDSALTERPSLTHHMDACRKVLIDWRSVVPELAGDCGVCAGDTLQELEDLLALAETVTRDPKPESSWFDRLRLLEIQERANQAMTHYATVRDARESLLVRYEAGFLAMPDIDELIAAFSTTFTGPLRYFRPAWWRTKKRLRTLCRDGQLDEPRILEDLRQSREARDSLAWLDENRTALAVDLGRHFAGADTDWSTVEAAIVLVRGLLDRFGREVPEALRRTLLSSGDVVARVGRLWQGVRDDRLALLQAISALNTWLPLDPPAFTARSLSDASLEGLAVWLEGVRKDLERLWAAADTILDCRITHPVGSIARLVADLDEAAAVVDEERKVVLAETNLRDDFGAFFQGLDTDWNSVRHALEWTGRVRELFAGQVPDGFVERATDTGSDLQHIADARTALVRQRGAMNSDLGTLCDYFPSGVRIAKTTLYAAPLPGLADWLEERVVQLGELNAWADLQNILQDAGEHGMRPFFEALVAEPEIARDVRGAFMKRFYSLWLDSAYAKEPTLRSFERHRQDDLVDRFRQLDIQIIEATQKVIQHQVRPQYEERRTKDQYSRSSFFAQSEELLRQTRLQRVRKTIRRFFEDFPDVILELKPCLLMSPLSVAQFLPLGTVQFDVIIYDEASQIRPADAVGAMLRGKQVIVAGDRQQLPPTSFFDVTDGEEEDDDLSEEELAARDQFESILDECSPILSNHALRMHYRSRHQSLIAFSNRHFYNNDLFVFPCVCGDGYCPGVSLEYVEGGVYDRGKSRTNRAEAQRVVRLIAQHFRERPAESLGVIAFSQAQEAAIDQAKEAWLEMHPEMRRFFTEEGNEPFFIKSIETVQGDERDCIILSVGYGKDAAGLMVQNFGPVNKPGGYRRLNVAVTRAKKHLTLVTSVRSGDIAVTADAQTLGGRRLLKEYIRYAEQGANALNTEPVPMGLEADSPFEEEVCREVERLGYTVHKQVGCSGYRIDLAVVDPQQPGRYLLGIECDGAMYHSAKTARERDRLRQQVLEGLGWNIHRIWSTEWVKNRRVELERIESALRC